MKKVFSILLLASFLFNLGGYYLVFWALKMKANEELSSRLDIGNYHEHETFEIKIPLSLPYPLQSNGFERQTGHFVYKDNHYQLVKQKYENDTLTVVCIKDYDNNRLTKVMDSFTEKTGSKPIEDGSLNIPGKILSEYISSVSVTLSNSLGWSQLINPTQYIEQTPSSVFLLESPPPKS